MNYSEDFSINKAISLSYRIIMALNGDTKKINYLKLMKLLYLTERQHYTSYGRFITHDTFVSMKYGPVLSNTYNAIKNELCDAESQERWNTYFSTEISTQMRKYDLVITQDIDGTGLLQNEEITADVIVNNFGNMTEFELVDFVHEVLEEWDDSVGSTSKPITIEDIKKHIPKLSIEDIDAMISA